MRTRIVYRPWGTRTFYSNGEQIDRTHDGVIIEPNLMNPGSILSRNEQDRREDLVAHNEQNRILDDVKSILSRLHREIGRLERTPGPAVSGRKVRDLRARVEALMEDVEELVHPGGDDSD